MADGSPLGATAVLGGRSGAVVCRGCRAATRSRTLRGPAPSCVGGRRDPAWLAAPTSRRLGGARPIIGGPPPCQTLVAGRTTVAAVRSERRALAGGRGALRLDLGRSWWPGSSPSRCPPTRTASADRSRPLALATPAGRLCRPVSQAARKGSPPASSSRPNLSAWREVVAGATPRSAGALSTPCASTVRHRSPAD